MKNKSIGIRFLMVAILMGVHISSRVVAMEESSAKKMKIINDKINTQNQLQQYLLSPGYDDKKFNQRTTVANALNEIIKNDWIKEKIPGQQITFIPLIEGVALRYRLEKENDAYKAYPYEPSEMKPRRK